MPEPSIEDQLKLAQVEKIRAEIRKLDRETTLVLSNVRGHAWAEAVKIVGGIILGLGGITAAYTQYQVAEEKATRMRSSTLPSRIV